MIKFEKLIWSLIDEASPCEVLAPLVVKTTLI